MQPKSVFAPKRCTSTRLLGAAALLVLAASHGATLAAAQAPPTVAPWYVNCAVAESGFVSTSHRRCEDCLVDFLATGLASPWCAATADCVCLRARTPGRDAPPRVRWYADCSAADSGFSGTLRRQCEECVAAYRVFGDVSRWCDTTTDCACISYLPPSATGREGAAVFAWFEWCLEGASGYTGTSHAQCAACVADYRATGIVSAFCATTRDCVCLAYAPTRSANGDGALPPATAAWYVGCDSGESDVHGTSNAACDACVVDYHTAGQVSTWCARTLDCLCVTWELSATGARVPVRRPAVRSAAPPAAGGVGGVGGVSWATIGGAAGGALAFVVIAVVAAVVVVRFVRRRNAASRSASGGNDVTQPDHATDGDEDDGRSFGAHEPATGGALTRAKVIPFTPKAADDASAAAADAGTPDSGPIAHHQDPEQGTVVRVSDEAAPVAFDAPHCFRGADV